MKNLLGMVTVFIFLTGTGGVFLTGCAHTKQWHHDDFSVKSPRGPKTEEDLKIDTEYCWYKGNDEVPVHIGQLTNSQIEDQRFAHRDWCMLMLGWIYK